MKYNYSKAVITGALVLALATGGTVMADSIRAERDIDNKVSLVTTDDGKTEDTGTVSQQPGDQTQQDAGVGTADDSTALIDAIQALRNARNDARLQELEEELKGYVDAGSLTQEQADLILENAKEHQMGDMKRNKGDLSRYKGDLNPQDQMTDPSMPNRQGKRQRMYGQQSQNPQNQPSQIQNPQNQDSQSQWPQNQPPLYQQPQNQNFQIPNSQSF